LVEAFTKKKEKCKNAGRRSPRAQFSSSGKLIFLSSTLLGTLIVALTGLVVALNYGTFTFYFLAQTHKKRTNINIEN